MTNFPLGQKFTLSLISNVRTQKFVAQAHVEQWVVPFKPGPNQ